VCGIATQSGAFFCANGHSLRAAVVGPPEPPGLEPSSRPTEAPGAEPLAVPLDATPKVSPSTFRTPSEPDQLPPLRTLRFQVGVADAAAGRSNESEAALLRALEEPGESPGEWEIRFHLARTFEAQSRNRDALREYLTALTHAPDRVETLLPFAHSVLTPEIATSELAWLEREWLPNLAEVGPVADRAAVLLFVGRANLWAQSYVRAREVFSEALRLVPDDARLVEGFAEAQWRTNELASALESFERARSLVSAHPERLTAIESKIAGVLVSLGRYADALAQIDRVLEGSDRYAHELELNRAQCHLALDRPAEALLAGEEAARRKPGTVAPHLLRAQALIALHRYEEAVTEVDTAMRFDPTRRALMFCKAQALAEGQIDMDQAERLLTRCAEGKPPDEAIPRSLLPGLEARQLDGNLRFFLAFLDRMLGRPEYALEGVDRALDLGLTAELVYPEAAAYLLKAELLEKLDRRPEAGEYFLHAGSRIVDTDPVRAIELLTKAVSYAGDPAEAHWYLADAFLAAIPTSEPPYVDEDYLRKGFNAWTRAYEEVGPPRHQWAWAYLTAALLVENATKLSRETLSSLDAVDSHEDAWWRAVGLVERGIALDPDNSYAWALLTGYFRNLDCYANALQASKRAVELEETPRELGPRAATLVQLGQEGATEVIEEYLRLASSSERPWGSMLMGYALTGENRFVDAIPHFDAALEAEPDEPLYLFHRGRTLSLAGEVDAARRDFETLLALTEPGERLAVPDNRQRRAWAAFALGRYDKAKEILLELVEEYGEGDHEVEVALAWCCFGLGKSKEADAWFKRALEHARHANQLHETLQDLEEFERRLTAEGRRGRELKRLGTYRQRLQERRKQFPDSLDDERHAFMELQAVADGASLESPAAIGSRATLARMHSAADRWREAGLEYAALARRTSGNPMLIFPEAELGLVESIDAIVLDAEIHAAADETESALEALAWALDLVDSLPQGASGRPELLARIGYAYFEMSSDVAAVRDAFTTALELYREQGVEDPGQALADILTPHIGGSRPFWDLDHRLDSMREGAEPSVADGLERARGALVVFLDRHYGLASSVGPFREGVVVELGDRLVPEDTSPEGPLFGTYMPALREEFLRAWLFEPPGVLFRPSGDAHLPDAYALRVHGALAERGTVQPELRFARATPVEAGAICSEVVPGPDPATGILGSWVDATGADALAAAGYDVLETPLSFVLRHLRQVLRLNVTDLLGLQETEAVLEAWSETDSKALLDELTLDLSGKVGMAGLLRTLARDGLPLSGEEILEAVHQTGIDADDAGPTVRLIRLALRQHLPGNGGDATLVEVPSEWENRLAPLLRRIDGRLRLDASPPELVGLSAEIVSWMDPGLRGQTLVTANVDLRPFVQRLVRGQYPLATVLSADEVVLRPAEAPGEASFATHIDDTDV
jgi:tetratricopeptide (TPR) repeat protein